MTGLSWHFTEVAPKGREIIGEVICRTSRIGGLWNSTNRCDDLARTALQEASRIEKHGIALVEIAKPALDVAKPPAIICSHNGVIAQESTQ